MSDWKSKNVLITGASSGIGEAFAHQLAREGANLIITARSKEPLETLSGRLRAQYGAGVTVICADLASPNGPRQIYEETIRSSTRVDLLINNAGFGALGEFADMSLPRQLEMIQVNVTALVELSHLMVRQMKERGDGAILNVASTASFQAVPYFAVYGATKAFVLSFSEALWLECRPYGIRVMALCPGSTATNFQEVAGSKKINGPRFIQSAEEVAREGLAGLSRGRSHVIAGLTNRIQTTMQRLVPRDVVTRLAGKVFRPNPK